MEFEHMVWNKLKSPSTKPAAAQDQVRLWSNGGLRHVQPVSGAREAELFGDGYEMAKLLNFAVA
jgi:hypothetical protein